MIELKDEWKRLVKKYKSAMQQEWEAIVKEQYERDVATLNKEKAAAKAGLEKVFGMLSIDELLETARWDDEVRQFLLWLLDMPKRPPLPSEDVTLNMPTKLAETMSKARR